MTEHAFAIGLNATRSEHRSTDFNGRPVDPGAETETQRTDRVLALQERWQPHAAPTSDPGECLQEWMAARPENRMSSLAMRLAEDPSLLPEAEDEPGPGQAPKPGGLVERARELRAAKM